MSKIQAQRYPHGWCCWKGKSRRSLLAGTCVFLLMASGAHATGPSEERPLQDLGAVCTETPARSQAHAMLLAHVGGEDQMMSPQMGTQSMAALASLQGREFDIAYMSQMIAHHQGAIDMARQALEVARRADTRSEAQKVIDAQTKEIAQMQEWLRNWYQTGPDPRQQELMMEDMAPMMAMRVQSDKMFYQMMIPHHERAIEMAALGLERAQQEDLRTMSADIQKKQSAEIRKYRNKLGKL